MFVFVSADLKKGFVCPTLLEHCFQQDPVWVSKLPTEDDSTGAVARAAGAAALKAPEVAECKHDTAAHSTKSCSYVGAISCGDHGVAMCGFVSPSPESLRAFMLLVLRFRGMLEAAAAEGKSVQLIYDSACQFWHYVDKRCPELAAVLM